MTHKIILTDHSLEQDGVCVDCDAQGIELLNRLYHEEIGAYPKYFKMDLLGKVGFVASELLLQRECAGAVEERPYYGTDLRAVLLFGRAGSLYADRRYQSTIANREAFFPSPSYFVYTLPNIVTGEIAIRNRYYGETDYLLMGDKDWDEMRRHIDAVFSDGHAESVLAGWLDCYDENHFTAELIIVTNDQRTESVICQVADYKIK